MKSTLNACILSCKKLYIALFVFLPFSLWGSHFSGSTLYYEKIDACTMRLYNTSFYDCTGAGVQNAILTGGMANYIPFLGVSSYPPGTAIPVGNNWIFDGYEEQTPVCPSVVTNCNGGSFPSFVAVNFHIDIPTCSMVNPIDSILYQFSTCCRAYGLTSGAGGDGMLISLPVRGMNFQPFMSNSSPRFIHYPNNYIIAGDTNVIDLAAFDKDGDSLSYELVPCRDGINILVSLLPGYTHTAPLGPTWDVSLDAQTGKMTFLPNPGAIVSASVAVKVTEWRKINNVYVDIGYVPIDFTLTVINNSQVASVPEISAPFAVSGGFFTPPSLFTTYANAPFSVDFTATSSGTTPLSMDENLLQDYAPFLQTTQTPNNPLSIHIAGIPALADTGLRALPIHVSDSTCPINYKQYANYQLRVKEAGIYANITHTPCDTAIGSIDLVVLGNLVPPFTYAWSTGDTTEDLFNLPSGQYSVVVSDANGWTAQDSFWVQGLGVNLDFVVTDADCSNQNGAIQLLVTGTGTPPYAYNWSNGATTANLFNLSAGGFSVNVTDSLGCEVHAVTLLSQADSCMNVIEGDVYWDVNNDCVMNAGDQPLAFIPVGVLINNGMFYDIVWTDAMGHYRFETDEAGSYEVRVYPGSSNTNMWDINESTCLPTQSYAFAYPTVGNDTSDISFPFYLINQNVATDYYVELTESNFFRANVIHTTNIMVGNAGTTTTPTYITYHYSDVIDEGSITFFPSMGLLDTVQNTVTWSINSIPLFNYYGFTVEGLVNPAVAIGDSANTWVEINPGINETVLSNNIAASNSFVLAAYDPNIKKVSPQGVGSWGLISPEDTVLTYTIHFQNTGNAPAEYVIIKDTLDPALDITSFMPGGSSFPYSLTSENGNVLVFTFAHIQLPDSATDEAGSHGFVKFKMQLKPNLPLNTHIQNSADIYFDFNPPIITPKVQNTIYLPPFINLPNDSLMCLGDTLRTEIDFQPFGPYVFVWHDGSTLPYFVVNQTGTIGASVQDVYGFGAWDSTFIQLKPEPDADFSLALTANMVQCTPLNPTPNAGYVWNFGDGTSSNLPSPTHTYLTSGNYNIGLYAFNDCGGDTHIQQVSVITDIEQEGLEGVVVYPNPSNGSIHIQNKSGIYPWSIVISDASGRQIEAIKDIQTPDVKLTKALAPGVYFIEVEGKQGRWKLVVR